MSKLKEACIGVLICTCAVNVMNLLEMCENFFINGWKLIVTVTAVDLCKRSLQRID